LDNKPYIDIDNSGNVFVTDPEGYRVLQFTGEGEFVKFWGDYGTGSDTFGMPIGIVVDDEGNIWVTDTANTRIMSFPLVLP
jgi:DNA-binding beta-propeller fold protein YncE